MMTIEDILKSLEAKMLEDGLTRSELARRMDITRGTVTNFFNKPRVELGLATVLKYCEMLGLKLEVRDDDS